MKFTQAVKTHFQNRLLRYIGPNTRLVQEDIIWYFNFKKKDEWLIIPKGYISDLDSIPLIIKWLFPLSIASLFHDYAFEKGYVEMTKECFDKRYWDESCVYTLSAEGEKYTRGIGFFEANKMYRDMLIVEGVWKIDAYLRRIILNLFSWITWVKNG